MIQRMIVLCVGVMLGSSTWAEEADSFSCAGVPDRDVEPLVRTQPAYPVEAAMFCVEGHARYTFRILPDGSVDDVEVIESVPEGAFDHTGQVFDFWRFSPRCVDGEAVSRTATQQIDFSLPRGETSHCDGGLPESVLPLQVELVALMQRIHEAMRTGDSPGIDKAPVLGPPYAVIEGAYRRFFRAQADLMLRELRPWSADVAKQLGRAERTSAIDLGHQLDRLEELRRRYDDSSAEWRRLAKRFSVELAEAAASSSLDSAVRRVFVDPMVDARALNAELQLGMQPTLTLLDRESAVLEWLIDHDHEWERAVGELRFASARLEAEYRALALARDVALERVRLQAARESMMWSSG